MRFIVFYNNHPKVQDYSVRVWDNSTCHPNFNGEMTHPSFIRHYKLNPQDVSSVGYVSYNSTTEQWEKDKSRSTVFFKPDNGGEKRDLDLVLKHMDENYHNDEGAKRTSQEEQWAIVQARIARSARSA